jgi:6-phosphogluconolactonase
MLEFYIGGYGSTIDRAQLDEKSGELSVIGEAAGLPRASYLCYSQAYRSLYACGETGDADTSGRITRFLVGESGDLVSKDAVASCGADPCHIVVDADRGLAIASNYSGSTVGLFTLGPDGGLPNSASCITHEGSSTHPSRQTIAHPHGATYSPDDRFVFVCDLGCDEIVRYAFAGPDGAELELSGRIPIEPGSGPRHLLFSPEGHGYLLNELFNTVMVFHYDPSDGGLRLVQTVGMLPAQWSGESTAAEIQIHPNGRFIYASNRGADSIAVFSRDASTGRLGSTTWFDVKGATPRHFTIDPTGKWIVVALQDSDEVRSFLIDERSGVGRPTGSVISASRPTSIEFIR